MSNVFILYIQYCFLVFYSPPQVTITKYIYNNAWRKPVLETVIVNVEKGNNCMISVKCIFRYCIFSMYFPPETEIMKSCIDLQHWLKQKLLWRQLSRMSGNEKVFYLESDFYLYNWLRFKIREPHNRPNMCSFSAKKTTWRK